MSLYIRKNYILFKKVYKIYYIIMSDLKTAINVFSEKTSAIWQHLAHYICIRGFHRVN